jgi:Fe-S-cluster containining protein
MAEVNRLAKHLRMSVEEFGKRYMRQVGIRTSLIERPGGDCIFWSKDQGCTVYPARPVQCRTWPFWPENIETEEDWGRTRSVCPGSGQGTLYTITEIQRAARRSPE